MGWKFLLPICAESGSYVLSNMDVSPNNTLLEIISRSEVSGLAWMVIVLVSLGPQ